MALPEIDPDDLESAPRPVRVGSQLSPEDQDAALTLMAPDDLSDSRAWLACTVFVVTRTGRLDRHQRRPVARLSLP